MIYFDIFLIIAVPFLLIIFHKVDIKGAFASAILGSLLLFCEGYKSVLLIMVMLFLVFITKKKEVNDRRGFSNIVVALVIPILMIVSAFLFDDLFLVYFAAAISFVASDTVSSNVGRGKIYRMLKVSGTPDVSSGGVTIFGSIAGIIASLIISISFYFIFKMEFSYSFVIFVSGVFSNIIDSVTGSFLQAKYRCCRCDTISDDLVHCSVNGVLVSGVSFIGNTFVNFLGSISSVVIVFLLI